ncbi:hypothetical protein [Streptomyces tsukubensis]|uniref:Uncharacterized protein n=1 Tax=Streptomyces tsukubensis TaxID=83656 RepID=A0A1V4A2Y1_9ACTN|nr:hypothetical protein [Streptomyces tsukubensis]OON74411.1 hypothetical protein B1H18_25325 [Streptomyces tsukubensis]QFR95350.1 hypothetical protein GBW32_22880 [Streptomyces tsukubensis]
MTAKASVTASTPFSVRLALVTGAMEVHLRRRFPRLMWALVPRPAVRDKPFAELQRLESEPEFREVFSAQLDAAIIARWAERAAESDALLGNTEATTEQPPPPGPPPVTENVARDEDDRRRSPAVLDPRHPLRPVRGGTANRLRLHPGAIALDRRPDGPRPAQPAHRSHRPPGNGHL